jgi:hypothetical protein
MSLVGYRWWYAGSRDGSGWRLRSIYRSVWWEGPHLVASSPPRTVRMDDAIPPHGCDRGNVCSCGIYAYKSETLALGHPPADVSSLDEPFYLVWGAVGLWGKVVEHHRGYRSEHAVIRRLVVPARLVIHWWGMGQFTWCVAVDDGAEREVTEYVPACEMAESLARRYGVDVEVGAEIEMGL